jgi:hypothetical protein
MRHLSPFDYVDEAYKQATSKSKVSNNITEVLIPLQTMYQSLASTACLRARIPVAFATRQRRRKDVTVLPEQNGSKSVAITGDCPDEH